jgi:predicted ester cyclase
MADDNKARAQQFLDQVINAQGGPKFDDFVSPNAVPHHVPPGMPAGVEGWKAMVTGVFSVFPGWRITSDDIFAVGDRVAIRWTCEATNSGDFMGIPGTGKAVVMNGMIIDRWADGISSPNSSPPTRSGRRCGPSAATWPGSSWGSSTRSTTSIPSPNRFSQPPGPRAPTFQ